MMSSIQTSVPTFYGPRFCEPSSRSSSLSPPSHFCSGKPNWKNVRRNINHGQLCKAMVQETTIQGGGGGGGPSAAYAREMERLSAKESLLIALKDAGGFKAAVTGKATEMQRIDVMERITVLERLNPTPRPTTSPYLEGRWNFEWLVSGSPAGQFVLERFPTTLANISKMDLFLKDNYAKVTASLRLLNSGCIPIILNEMSKNVGSLMAVFAGALQKLETTVGNTSGRFLLPGTFLSLKSFPRNSKTSDGARGWTIRENLLRDNFRMSLGSKSRFTATAVPIDILVVKYLIKEHPVENKFTVSSKLSVEGPLRMKEEYAEGLLESPTVVDEAVPDQLRSVLGQATGAVQQLPVPIRDAISSGIRIPLSGTFQRLFMISYLDEEIFIIRDAFGAPEILTRSGLNPSDTEPDIILE